MTARRAGLVWGGLGVLAFSLSLPATRLAVSGGLSAEFVGVGRAVVAGVLALLVLASRGQAMPDRRALRRLGVVAGGVVIGFPWLTALALARVPAAHGSVVTGLLPAATAVAAVLRAGERPSPLFWAASVTGFACIVAYAVAEGGGAVGPADAMLLVAVAVCGLGYAEGAVLARELGGVAVICMALVLALPVTTALTLLALEPARLAAAAPSSWLGFGYVALFSMFLGFFAWYRGLALGGVARVGQLQLGQAVLSIGWSALLLGERVSAATLAVAVAVVACVMVTQRTR